jgi:hypothetical protein
MYTVATVDVRSASNPENQITLLKIHAINLCAIISASPSTGVAPGRRPRRYHPRSLDREFRRRNRDLVTAASIR